MGNLGILTDRIPLDATTVNMADDKSLWCAAEDFLVWAIAEAHLLVGEFPETLYDMNKISYYAGQVAPAAWPSSGLLNK